MAKSLRIFYAAGPGNVIGTYRHWKDGKDDPTQIAMTYSGQFYDVVRELDAVACVTANCRAPTGKLNDGNVRIIHRGVPFEFSSGLLYHLGQIWGGIRMLFSALRIRANVAVVCAGTHWFCLVLMRLFGIKVIPTIHCVLWPKYNWRPTLIQRLILWLNGRFLRKHCAAIISVSDEITQQIEEITQGRHPPIAQFIPQYRRESFKRITPPSAKREPFYILYGGRIERNKGVFDLLEIAQRFEREGKTHYEFDICGTGSALSDLRHAAEEVGLAHRFRIHGHLDQETMRAKYSQSHVVIVPTTSDFSEGFNKVVAEGVLAGRPVITSSVCPALAYVRESVVEVPPDDIEGYAAAIESLYNDLAFYQSKCRACASAEDQFFDPRLGWAAALKTALTSIDGHSPTTPNWVAKPAGKLS